MGVRNDQGLTSDSTQKDDGDGEALSIRVARARELDKRVGAVLAKRNLVGLVVVVKRRKVMRIIQPALRQKMRVRRQATLLRCTAERQHSRRSRGARSETLNVDDSRKILRIPSMGNGPHVYRIRGPAGATPPLLGKSQNRALKRLSQNVLKYQECNVIPNL